MDERIQLLWKNWDKIRKLALTGMLTDGKPQLCYLDEDNNPCKTRPRSEKLGLLIPTDDGIETAVEGDWITKNDLGEIIICK